MRRVTIQFDTDNDTMVENLTVGAVHDEGFTITYGGGQAFIEHASVSWGYVPSETKWEHMDESDCDDPNNVEAHPFCFAHDRRIFAKGTRR